MTSSLSLNTFLNNSLLTNTSKRHFTKKSFTIWLHLSPENPKSSQKVADSAAFVAARGWRRVATLAARSECHAGAVRGAVREASPALVSHSLSLAHTPSHSTSVAVESAPAEYGVSVKCLQARPACSPCESPPSGKRPRRRFEKHASSASVTPAVPAERWTNRGRARARQHTSRRRRDSRTGPDAPAPDALLRSASLKHHV